MSATGATLLSGLEDTLAQGTPPLRDRDPAWVRTARSTAAEWVARHGFPTRKDEDWRYTRVRPIVQAPFQSAATAPPRRRPSMNEINALLDTRALLASAAVDQAAVDQAQGLLWAPATGALQLVFVNGRYAPECSSPPAGISGLTITSLTSVLLDERASLEPLLAAATPPHHAFAALNTALWEDGAFIRLAPHTTVRVPIRLVFVTDVGPEAIASYPRSVILAGAGSSADIIELHVAVEHDTAQAQVSLANAVTHVVLDESAQVTHTTVQNERETGFHLALLDVRQGADSTFTGRSFAIGAAIGRREVRVALQAPGATAILEGLYVPRGHQHHDNPVLVEHCAPHGTSRQLYKGVVDERGHGVFNGHLIVHPGAIATDANQTNKNLLLSDRAEVDTRPRLEILNDDVKCTHGASVGQLDDEAVFYLRSRGLTDRAARDLLAYGFANEMVRRVPLPSLQAFVARLVTDHLSRASEDVAP